VRIAQVVLGVVVAALGGFAVFAAAGLDMFGEHGVPGPGFFPELLAGALVVLGVLLAVVSVVRIRRETGGIGIAGVQTAPAEDFDLRTMVRAGRVWIGFAASVPLLVLVGFVPAMALLVAYLLFAVERLRGLRPLAAVILIPVLIYLVFAYLLAVDLPLGSLFGQS
jgi:putative tricarboxylic transport membrane protein